MMKLYVNVVHSGIKFLLLFAFFLLLASCGGGGSDTSSLGSIPSAPTGVSAVAGDGQVTISWNGVSGATSYNLYMAPQSPVTKSNYASLLDGMKHIEVTNPFTHTGLTDGKTYYFGVNPFLS